MKNIGLDERSEMVEQSIQTDKWEPKAGGLIPALLLVAGCCLVLIVLAITLPLVLIDNDDDNQRDLPVGTTSVTPSPVLASSTPTRSPTTSVSIFLQCRASFSSKD
jgi:hypothetical protein